MSNEILRTISHSERDCFNNCRALWHARYLHPVEHLVLGVLKRKAARALATWAPEPSRVFTGSADRLR